MSTAEKILPKPVDGPGLAFGDIAQLPAWETLPDEYKSRRAEWCKFVTHWFYKGIEGVEVEPQDGIDLELALNVISACLRSWTPKHEHKIGGTGYLCSLWLKSFKLPQDAAT